MLSRLCNLTTLPPPTHKALLVLIPMVMGLLSPRGSQILQHQMQVQPSPKQELVQILHWKLDEECGRLLVTFSTISSGFY